MKQFKTSITIAALLELEEAINAYSETFVFKNERYGYGACHEETLLGHRFEDGDICFVVEINEGCGDRWISENWGRISFEDLMDWWQDHEQKELERLLDELG